MSKPRIAKKGAALLFVLGTLLIVTILANVIMGIMLSQSRITHHEISRIRAYYAASALMNYTLDMLRVGTWTANPLGGAIKYACLNGCVDTVTPSYTINDSDIPYNVQVAINPEESGISNTIKLAIKTEYTYTP
jgi:Tfp pilus assembly protein PilX